MLFLSLNYWKQILKMKSKNKLKFRQALNGDINKILELEFDCYKNPLEKYQIQRYLKNGTILIVEDGKTPVGYVIYEHSALTGKQTVEIYALGVTPNYRRKGIGSELIEYVRAGGIKEVFCVVRETNLDAQLFLKKMDFKCIDQIKKHWLDSDELAYVFRYESNSPVFVEN